MIAPTEPESTVTRTRASLFPKPKVPRDGSCKTVISTSSRRFLSLARACNTASSTLLPLASMLSTVLLPPFISIPDEKPTLLFSFVRHFSLAYFHDGAQMRCCCASDDAQTMSHSRMSWTLSYFPRDHYCSQSLLLARYLFSPVLFLFQIGRASCRERV